MNPQAAAIAPATRGRDPLEQLWVVFVCTWAIAVLFHIAGNTRLGEPWGRGALGFAAVAVLAVPRSRWSAIGLGVAVLVNVWLEAPLLSNHWLLHAFIAMVVLGGSALRPSSGAELVARIRSPLRLLLLVFYVFAAFAKLNSDFFDPVVSCARFYFEESARSWNLGSLVDGSSATSLQPVAFVVAGVELAVPVLLVLRRTRLMGVLVALGFHFVLALDRTHQFFDFSAVLACLFILFLPEGNVAAAVHRLRALRSALASRWLSGPELARLSGLAFAGFVVVIAAGPSDWPAPPLLRNVGVIAWIAYGLGVIGFAALAGRAGGRPDEPLLPTGTSRLLLAIPALAALNGVTPYLEVKTAASWNMYSNLAVVDGQSNHLLVPGGLALTDAHERLVEVTEADGVDLDFYIGTDWRLPEVMLTDHLAARPGAVVLGTVGSQDVRYEGGEGGARPIWQRKLQVFRAVAGDGPVGCQPSFGPAR